MEKDSCFTLFIKQFNKKLDLVFDHPKNVCMTYTEHATFSLNLSYLYLQASLKGVIHAVNPESYKTYAQDVNKKTSELLKSTGCK